MHLCRTLTLEARSHLGRKTEQLVSDGPDDSCPCLAHELSGDELTSPLGVLERVPVGLFFREPRAILIEIQTVLDRSQHEPIDAAFEVIRAIRIARKSFFGPIANRARGDFERFRCLLLGKPRK